MTSISRFARRALFGLRTLIGRRRAEAELDAELQSFLDSAIEAGMRAGLSRPAATRAARLQLGSPVAVKDRVRDVGWASRIDSLWQDLRYAVRILRKSPGFTSAAVLTLALGIGATTAIFGLLDSVLLRALPVPHPEQLVVVIGGPQYPAFQAFRRSGIFVDLLATSGVTRLEVESEVGGREPADVALVSGSYFSTLGIHAAAGRVFTAADDRVRGAHRVAVASHAYWQRRLGGDPAIVDRDVRISGTPITIIGVAPRGFFGEEVGAAPDLWVPLTMWGDVVPGRNLLDNPGTGWLRMIGRVAPGVKTAGLQPELTRMFQEVLGAIFGPEPSDDLKREIANARILLEPAARGLSGVRAGFGRPLQLLMGAVVLVLLIACANVANLLLARASARRREIDLRLALGVGRARLVRQLLTESAVLATLGGTAGVLVAGVGREALLRLISEDGSRIPIAAGTDARLLSFVVAISAVAVLLFGLAPAWHAVRAHAGRSLLTRTPCQAPRGQRLGSVLVVAEVAISLVLLMGAGLLLRTIANLRAVDLGFAPERLLVVDVNPQTAGIAGEGAVDLGRRLLAQMSSVAGVSSVSLSENGVLMGRDSTTNVMHADGMAASAEGFPRAHWDVVGPRYFSTIGTPLLSGRDFTAGDVAGAPPVVAINDAMARRFFGAANPLGRRLFWNVTDARVSLEVVAVARDAKPDGPRREPELRFYLPYFQLLAIRGSWNVASLRLLVRTSAGPAVLADGLRQAIAAEEPRLSMTSVVLGPELVTRTLVRERMVATLLVAFGSLAVGLACLGLYGVIAYRVVQRTNEIGIRMALGAGRRDVLRATLGQALVWIAAGVTLGVPLALSTSHLAASLLFGLSASDPVVLAGAAALMSALGLLAAYLPARRASTMDPLVALRHE